MITENDRLDLRQKLDKVLGPRLSEIAMEAMPPLHYDQFATKQDVANLGIELRGDLALMEARLQGQIVDLSGDMGKQLRQYFLANVAVTMTMLGFVVGLT